MLLFRKQGPDGASWAQMIRRIDVAAATGGIDRASCAQFYCPPPIPTLEEKIDGDSYQPPPSHQFDTPVVHQLHPVFSDQQTGIDLNALALTLNPEQLASLAAKASTRLAEADHQSSQSVEFSSVARSGEGLDDLVAKRSVPKLKRPSYPRVAVQKTAESDDVLQLGSVAKQAVFALSDDSTLDNDDSKKNSASETSTDDGTT